MAITLGSTGITFNDGSTQTTRYDTEFDKGKLLSISAYTVAGSYTWSKPPGCTSVLVRTVGAGGGASGYCESGGAGGFAERLIDVTSVSTVAVTVGAGGAGTAYSGTGGLGITGGTSSFGSYITATGGFGSNRNFNHTGGFGGVGSGGNINLYGGTGTGHTNGAGQGAVARGGESYFGGGAGNNRNLATGKNGNGAPGAGGAGNRTDDGSAAGGAGEDGAVIIWEYK